MSEKQIKWKNGARYKCTATSAYRFFERIRDENNGNLDLDDAVHKSKPKDAPLHNDLEWNDGICGQRYRLDQMRKMVSEINVIRQDMSVPTMAYESTTVDVVSSDTSGEPVEPQRRSVFRRTEDILADPVARAELLGQAVRDAISFRRRYAALSELATLIEVIDEEVKRLA
jgi:hypothetical protein